jgi:hypothetical protein
MSNIIALTQFIILTLGTLGVNILMKTSQQEVALGKTAHSLPGFLANYSIWIFLIPVLWVMYARVSEVVQKGAFTTRFSHPLGIVLNILLALLYVYAIFFYF